MAHMTDTARSHDAVPVLHRAIGLRAGLAERFGKYRLYRRTLDELASLSERELADLGIHRSQIREIATQAAYSA